MISILTFKPVLIGCQYGLYVVYGALTQKKPKSKELLALKSKKAG